MGDQIDLETAFATAASLLNRGGHRIEAKFHPYAGLKSTIRLREGAILAKVSDGYAAADLDALTGLALDLMGKLFRVRSYGERAEAYLARFRSLNGKGVYELHESLRSARGRRRSGNGEGKSYDLNGILEKVLADYPDIFSGVRRPSILWSRHVSQSRLAFFDTAFNQIVVSKKFDSGRQPQFFLEYLVFHELLHAKHDVKYGRRRRVHHREFRLDERKFAKYPEAAKLIGRG